MTGYKFAGWEGAQINEANESNTTVLVSEDISLSARFSELEYMVEVLAETGGSVSGSGTYKYGETVIIEAVPLDGYEFAGWEGQKWINTPKLKPLYLSMGISVCRQNTTSLSMNSP